MATIPGPWRARKARGPEGKQRLSFPKPIEDELIARAKLGDQEAIEKLLDKYWYLVLRRWNHTVTGASKERYFRYAKSNLVYAFKHYDPKRPNACLSSYLWLAIHAAMNKAERELERLKKVTTISPKKVIISVPIQNLEHLLGVPPAAEEHLLECERVNQFLDVLNQALILYSMGVYREPYEKLYLCTRDADIFRTYIAMDLDVEEVAYRFKCSVTLVKIIKRRVLSRLLQYNRLFVAELARLSGVPESKFHEVARR